MATTLLKNFLICSGQNTYHFFDLSPYSVNWWAKTVGSVPAGITVFQDADTESVGGLLVTYGVLASGINTVTLDAYVGVDGGEYLGRFTIQFQKTTCATEQEVCCDEDGMVIRWLGREGGIKEWPFPGVREFDVRVGDAITFKNSNNQVQYAERRNIYTGKRLTTGDITKEQADFLDELRYSIQAWEWDGTTATPIQLNNESFNKYSSRDKFFDVSISYVVSSEIQMQTQ